MCVNIVSHQLNNSIFSDMSTLLIILIWHYLIRLFVYPPLLLSTKLIQSFSGLILSLLTWGNYFVDHKINIYPLNLNLILLLLNFRSLYKKKYLSPNRHTSMICSVVMEYLLIKLINYLTP